MYRSTGSASASGLSSPVSSASPTGYPSKPSLNIDVSCAIRSEHVARLTTSPTTPRNPSVGQQVTVPLTSTNNTLIKDCSTRAKQQTSSPSTLSASGSLRPACPTCALSESEQSNMSSMTRVAVKREASRKNCVSDIVAVGNSDYLTSRHVLVDWMWDVAKAFRLLPTTLHAAVRHVDVFMARRRCRQSAWQLCAVACIFIAAKCEESCSKIPLMSELRHVCGDTYEAVLVRKMELCVLEVLEWDPLVVGPMHFLSFFLRTAQRVRNDNVSRNVCGVKRARGIDGDEYVGAESLPRKIIRVEGSPTPLPRVWDVSLTISKSWNMEVPGGSPREMGKNFVETEICSSVDAGRELSEASDDLREHFEELDRFDEEGEDRECGVDSTLDEEVAGLAEVSRALLDLAMFDPSLIHSHDPRVLAASALFIAQRTRGSGRVTRAEDSNTASDLAGGDAAASRAWDSSVLAGIAGVFEREIRPCWQALANAFADAFPATNGAAEVR